MKVISTVLLLVALMFPTSSSAREVILNKDNMLKMDDYFNGQSTAVVVQKAKELDARLKSNDPLFLVLDSGGGRIGYGLELIENLKHINRPIHTITLWSASMAFHTVQGLNKRYVLSYGTLMSHKPRGGFYGEFPGQLDARYMYYLKRIERMEKLVVKRTNGKHTLKTYRNLQENEYWCEGADCVAQGFADEVITAQCDKSLAGEHEKLWWRFMYLGRVIKIVDIKSDCPLVTGDIDWNIYIDGEPLWDKTKAPAKEEESYSPYYDESNELTAVELEELMAKVEPAVEKHKAEGRKLKIWYNWW